LKGWWASFSNERLQTGFAISDPQTMMPNHPLLQDE
jgi:hypothetical protein